MDKIRSEKKQHGKEIFWENVQARLAMDFLNCNMEARPNNSALNSIGKLFSTRKTQPNYQLCRLSLNKNAFTGEFYQKFREELTPTLLKFL